MKTTAKAPSTPSKKDPPKSTGAAKPHESPMAPQTTAGKPAAPSVAQPAGHRFQAPAAPSATPGMPSASKRLDKTP